jgi:small subunit ribosomal protein S17
MEETVNNQEAPVIENAPVAETSAPPATVRGRRTEKVGIVTSDKMMKTVVVRVDRLVKHPVYKRYVRKRTKFMAHNEIEGVSIGDQVRIVETRPLSAHKRWRVVEVLRKASK